LVPIFDRARKESDLGPLKRYLIVTQDDVIRFLLDDRQRLCSVAFAVVTDFPKAEDLFQDLVIKAVHRIEQFNDPDHLAKWSTTAIRNAAIDHVRKTQTRNQILSTLAYERVEHQKAEMESRFSENERRDALHLCMERLSDPERELLQRRYVEGQSGEELARAFGLSVSAIYTRLSRLHRKLKAAVESELSTSTPDLT